jgi:hypothetical protein
MGGTLSDRGHIGGVQELLRHSPDDCRWPRCERAGMTILAAVFNLNKPAHYIHWHFIQLSVPNLLLVLLMIVVFALAILLPFPGGRSR